MNNKRSKNNNSSSSSSSSLPPRRETAKRKAKEKITNKQLAEQHSDDDGGVDGAGGDDGGDPAWNPSAKTAIGAIVEVDDNNKKKKRGKIIVNKRGHKRMLDDDEYMSTIDAVSRIGGTNNKKKRTKRNSTKSSVKIDEKLLASISDEDIDISPFKAGEFVVIKSELNEEYPALWRIDGKTLLQKYEPFDSNGKILYRNISTYSGWSPQNRQIYQQVPVKFWLQEKMETVVEFLRDELILDDREFINKNIQENEQYQDSFEVYIQTLISQALDSNFLTEILHEKDDYFLSNVKTVDEITQERKRRLLSTTKWQQNVILAFSTWPCLNIIKDFTSAESKDKDCSGCHREKIFSRIFLYGQPYNESTLDSLYIHQPSPQDPQEKEFYLCRVCHKKAGLFNKVAHQKYLMFLECARRVNERKTVDKNKDTTTVLNELLADEAWLNQLFKDVRTIWAEIDSIEHQERQKENSKLKNTNKIQKNINSELPMIQGLTNHSSDYIESASVL